MTVCIGALCSNAREIVVASDTKIGFGAFSADDLTVKIQPLVKNWWVLFASADISEIPPILARSKEALRGGPTFNELTVPRAVLVAYAERLREQIEAQVLSRYGLTLGEFMANDSSQLSPDLYTRLSNAIAAVSLGTQLLIVGFDAGGLGHLIRLDSERSPANQDAVGFCAVGSGSYSAMSTLAYHADRQHLSIYSPLEDCIYCCCNAKFMAESAEGVGKSTLLAVFRNDQPIRFVPGLRIENEIRPAWEKYGAPRVPAAVLKAIPSTLLSVKDLAGADGIRNFLGEKGAKKPAKGQCMREFKNWRRFADLQKDQDTKEINSDTSQV